MAIVVGDIHGNVEKVRAFLAYKPEVEHVALGDYLDSFYEPQQRQIESLELLLDSNSVLLWGNHDLHYSLHPPFICSGYQHGRQEACCEIIRDNEDRFLAAYAVEGWLCSHAGVTEKLSGFRDEVETAAMLNQIIRDWRLDGNKRRTVFDIGHGRDGGAAMGGIFWYDFQREWGLDLGLKQIFGHTCMNEPVVNNKLMAKNYVCLDTTMNKEKVWLWDTEENNLVVLPMPDRRKRCRDCLVLHDFLNEDVTCTDCGRDA